MRIYKKNYYEKEELWRIWDGNLMQFDFEGFMIKNKDLSFKILSFELFKFPVLKTLKF